MSCSVYQETKGRHTPDPCNMSRTKAQHDATRTSSNLVTYRPIHQTPTPTTKPQRPNPPKPQTPQNFAASSKKNISTPTDIESAGVEMRSTLVSRRRRPRRRGRARSRPRRRRWVRSLPLLRRSSRPVLPQVLHLLRPQRTPRIGRLDRLLLLIEARPRLWRNRLVEQRRRSTHRPLPRPTCNHTLHRSAYRLLLRQVLTRPLLKNRLRRHH